MSWCRAPSGAVDQMFVYCLTANGPVRFEVSTAVAYSGMLRRVARVGTNVSEESSASIIRVIKIG
jgi:hypothetical protein